MKHPELLRGMVAFMLLAICALTTGCSDYEGPRRFTVSGTITYKGQPVPTGFIRFAPDTKKGNKGPGGGAPIKNGTFETPRSKGLIGGPHLITIRGTDGVTMTEEGEEVLDGNLFSYRTKQNLTSPKKTPSGTSKCQPSNVLAK